MSLDTVNGGWATIEQMGQPLIEGPGPPESVRIPPKRRVTGLVPFVRVEDVERSVAFYYHLGFSVASVYKYRGTSVWAELRSERAELMVSTDGDSIAARACSRLNRRARSP
jgi:hypothetical protein